MYFSSVGLKYSISDFGVYLAAQSGLELALKFDNFSKMEGVEESLAKLAGYAYSSDTAVSMSTGAVDLGEKPSVVSAIIKYHLTIRFYLIP